MFAMGEPHRVKVVRDSVLRLELRSLICNPLVFLFSDLDLVRSMENITCYSLLWLTKRAS